MYKEYYAAVAKLYVETFGGVFEGTPVPERLKETALAIMNRFTIGGLCDGMYICNAIARTCGIGDGCFTFYSGDILNFSEVAEYLQMSYGCNIPKEDLPELEEILRTGKPDKKKSEAGIEKYIKACEAEKKTCDEWRKDYLDRCITLAKENLSIIRKYC